MQKSFSERYGYTKASDILQTDGMTQELRNGLWSELLSCFPSLIQSRHFLCDQFWCDMYKYFFKQPIDDIPSFVYRRSLFKELYMTLPWFKVFNLMEFFLARELSPADKKEFTDAANLIFEQEGSGYRIIDGLVAEIIHEEELKEIETTQSSDLSSAIKIQIHQALKRLSDKQHPDYRASIKESISAVETLLREITGEKTFGPALKKIESHGIQIPKALEIGFQNLYGYTCGTDGIRHALMEEAIPVYFAEAKFMLVSCCAFINYIQTKRSNP